MFWVVAGGAVALIALLFLIGDFSRMWLDDRRLEGYARSNEDLLAYPALLREVGHGLDVAGREVDQHRDPS